MKLLTIAIPCYNSQEYMSHAVESALCGGEDVEIILINDGSTDDTLKIGMDYQKQYPDIIKIIDQENKGHGGAVNAGIANAGGLFFKVLDSDDWLDKKALQEVLDKLKEIISKGQSLDMLITNYVYEKVTEVKKKVIRYRSAMPENVLFNWNDVKQFKHGQYILMHSVIYRTRLLYDCNLLLPEHTFYVDNIFVYQPLPFVKNMYYMDLNLYRYFIGRENQSVTEANMIKRIDQQLFVNKLMIDCCDVMSLKNHKLKDYMIKYLTIMMTVSSVYLIKDGSAGRLKQKDELWEYLENKDKRLYNAVNSDMMVKPMQSRRMFFLRIVKIGYKIAKKIFKFG